VEKIGIFINEAPERVLGIAREAGLTGIQLHGDEDAAYIRGLRARAGEEGLSIRVFRAVAVQSGLTVALQDILQGDGVDGLLLDSPPASAKAHRGGSGRTFDWGLAAEVLQAVSLGERTRVVASGGLSPENVCAAIQSLRPWGVDVCSGVERETGRKDPSKVRAFVGAVRAAAHHG
jgi:phosphoribosylanthranilate isomerase